MIYQLILNTDGLSYYGNIPDVPYEDVSHAEAYEFEPKDWPQFDKDFIDPINNLCNTLLDYGDVDYLDTEKCEKLHDWLTNRLNEPTNARLKTLYQKLDEFAQRAIDLGTGVVIEF